MLAAPECLYEDDALLAIVKPSGLLAVPGRGADKADCLSARVQARWPGALVVHRLDEATSGLMLFARTPAVQRALSRAFEQREVDKRYVAVVHGLLPISPDWQLIDAPLAADWPNRPRQKVDAALGKAAQTRWRVLAHEGDFSRVALQPLTGRTHQLRVHLASIGRPIVGDRLYGSDAAPRLLLHATELGFAHPLSGTPLHLTNAAPF